ncbi:MAG: glycerol-3-phosphate 1-O-acyltransferase, partial [Mycobacteriaceae bacterium]
RESGDGTATTEVIDADEATLAARVGREDDPLVVPVRVAWLPRERAGDSPAGWSEVLSLATLRSPILRFQQRVARREPDRSRVVVGAPAMLSELRADFTATDGPQDDQHLARFILGRAMLALERAERNLTGDRYKVPRHVVEQITSSSAFRAQLRELADQLDLPESEVRARAMTALHELVAVQSRLAIDVWSAAMRPLHARAWKVEVDEAGLDQLRERNRKQALAFLPSHRSYADTLVLADVLHEHDFPRNHVMGGSNLSFWPIGPLARRAGMVFIRRSFSDDQVYKTVIQEYFGFLVSKRFNLEWYFEGGRSRTGKLRAPRYGLLRYVAAALQSGRAPDVSLVPVSITYEHLSEVSAMAGEQAGGTKQAEGLSWLANYARQQHHRAGRASVRFGTPFSMRERLPAPEADSHEQRVALQKIAFELAVGINRATPVTAESLVTLALLGVRDRALTLQEVSQVLDPVLNYVECRELPTCGVDLRRPRFVRTVLDHLTRAGVVTTYSGGEDPVYSIERGQHLVAAFYRNNSIHWFVDRAIVELATLYVAQSGSSDPVPDAWAEAKRLRDLLKFEFFFPEKEEYRADLIAELRQMSPEWESLATTVHSARELLAGAGFLMAHRVLRSFVDAQLVVAERLAAHDPRQPIDTKAFFTECSGVGRQMLLQGRLHSPEALSRELFDNALKLAANRDLVDPGRDELRARRDQFAAEVRDVVARVAAAETLDTSNRQEVGRVAL